MKVNVLLLALGTACLCGCQTYQFRVLKPPVDRPVITERPVDIHYEPLDYQLVGYRKNLAIRITNPTSDRIALLGERSFAVDPRGESHPLRTHVIGPHSYIRFVLPPQPLTFAYPDWNAWGWGWGWGWGPYDPFWSPFYGSTFWGPPPVSYYRVETPYDWDWKEGPVRLRLTYDRAGKVFEHDFEFVREPVPK